MKLSEHQVKILDNLCNILYSGRITNSKSKTKKLIDSLYEEDDRAYGLCKSELMEYVLGFIKKEWMNAYIQKADLRIRDLVPESMLNKNGYSDDDWESFNLQCIESADNVDEVYAAAIRDAKIKALQYREANAV